MPTYVGLGEQGFYKPFELLGAGLAARADRKQRRGEWDQQRALRERELLNQESAQDEHLITENLNRQLLRGQIKRLEPKQREPLPGMEPDHVTEDEYGNRSTVYKPAIPQVQVPPYLEPTEMTVDDPRTGRRTTYTKPISTGQKTEVIERPLPGGGKGTFLQTIDPKTGQETLRPYNPASDSGSGKVGSELLQKLNVTALALGQLPKYEEAVKASGHAGGPVASKVGTPFAWLFGPSPERLKFDTLKAQTLAPVAKGILGETGALSEADMSRYAPLLPTFDDTLITREAKLAELRRLLSESRDNILANLKATGYNADALGATPGLAPVSVAPPGAGGAPGGAPVKISSQEEYDKLSPGTVYIDSTGTPKTKH